jgi:hypothetical protein
MVCQHHSTVPTINASLGGSLLFCSDEALVTAIEINFMAPTLTAHNGSALEKR